MSLIKQDEGWRLRDQIWQQMEPLLPARKPHQLGCHNLRVSARAAMNLNPAVSRWPAGHLEA